MADPVPPVPEKPAGQGGVEVAEPERDRGPLRVLILEDRPEDARLMAAELTRHGFEVEWRRVDAETDFVAALDLAPQVILADYSIPGFGAPRALEVLRSRGIDLPFIVVTGSISEEVAAECIKGGAADYLLKDRLVRLGPAVDQALEQTRLRRERAEAARALQASEDRFRRLAENAADVIYRFEFEPPHFSYISPAITSVAGYTPEEFYADPDLVLAIVHPEDRPLAEAMRTGDAASGEAVTIRWIARDGSVRWAEHRQVLLHDEAGTVVATEGIVRDVTERKRADEALRASEERYRLLAENMSDVIWTMDLTGHLRYVSPSIARLCGFSVTEMIGRSFDEWLVPSSGADVRQALAEAIAAEIHGVRTEPRRIEVEALRKDGSTVWCEVSANATYSPAGEIIGIQGVTRDILERRRAEQALRRSEQNYRSVFEAANDAIVIFEPESEAIYDANPKACEMYGFSHGELVGMSMKALTQDVPRGEEQVRMLLRAGTYHGFETVQLAREGREINVLVNASIIEYQGRRAVLSMNRDITIRKRAEEDVRKSKQIIQGILDAIPVRVFWKDKDLAYLGCNAIFARDAGFAHPKDVIGKDDYQMGWHDQAGLYREDDRQVIESGCAKVLMEEPQTTPDGNIITLLTSKLPLRDSSGKVSGVLGTYMDITERKRAEDALRDSEARYRSLFDQSPLGIYRTTPDGTIVAANAALLQMLGYSSFEGLASRNLELDGYEPRFPRHEFKERIERDGEVMGFESGWLKKDGQVLDVRESARAVRGRDGRILYYEGTVEDVTPQRRAELERQRLVAAVEQASETIVITDTEGRIEYVNPAFERITGYAREEAIGQKSSLLKSGRQDDAYYAAMWQTITRGETWQGHFVNRRKDGTLYEEEATISTIRNNRGGIINFVAVKRDVTQEVALRAQLNQAQKMEAVGRLAGGVAHDFNNVLQALLSQAQLVRARGGERDRILASVGEMEQQIRRGAALTRQLLLFSRRETPRRTRLDLNEAVQGSVGMLRRLVRENVSFKLELAGEPLPVEADRGQLDQVLVNLVVNASDAMERGGQLAVRTWTAGQGWAWLEVRDTGVGIPNEVQIHIFEPFFTTKEAGKGTGLGLSVVHGIVEQHGGRILVESKVGEGTAFRVGLPLAIPSAFPRAVAAIEAFLPPGHGERVLVVEDETASREALRDILATLDYHVVAVGSGEEAGKLAAEPAFDVLVTDLGLPGCSGTDLTRGLRDRWPGLKVILMSGYTDAEATRQGIERGDVRFLQKPFDMATLARELRAALDET